MNANDETGVRREITEAMLIAGAMAYSDWADRCRTDPALSDLDLAASVYVAMRRATTCERRPNMTDSVERLPEIQAELERIHSRLLEVSEGNLYNELYMAQQALSWAINPHSASAPTEVLNRWEKVDCRPDVVKANHLHV